MPDVRVPKACRRVEILAAVIVPDPGAGALDDDAFGVRAGAERRERRPVAVQLCGHAVEGPVSMRCHSITSRRSIRMLNMAAKVRARPGITVDAVRAELHSNRVLTLWWVMVLRMHMARLSRGALQLKPATGVAARARL